MLNDYRNTMQITENPSKYKLCKYKAVASYYSRLLSFSKVPKCDVCIKVHSIHYNIKDEVYARNAPSHHKHMKKIWWKGMISELIYEIQ